MMSAPPPVLARVLRGDRIESVHRGDVAVVDEDGRLLACAGSPETCIYVRSAAKPFQAMPLLEAGGERTFRLGSDEIALLCASHGGEPRHVRVARRLLSRGRFRVRDLACGAHLPMHEPSARAMVARGQRPTALHNNCSGKHAGLLLACRLFDFDPAGYWKPMHAIEQKVLDRISDYCETPSHRIGIAVDGCSLPVFFLPLSALARGYARLLSRQRRGEAAGEAAVRARICRAMWESPAMVAGLGRFTTDFLDAGGGRWIGKEGAEGVYAIGIRSPAADGKSIGIAFKVEDGSSRARDAVALDILERLGWLSAAARRSLSPHRSPVVRNVRGAAVGRIEAVVALAGEAVDARAVWG
ncbi:MAG: asparaginase [Thermoanaerobaculia bacterium]